MRRLKGTPQMGQKACKIVYDDTPVVIGICQSFFFFSVLGIGVVYCLQASIGRAELFRLQPASSRARRNRTSGI